MKEVDDQFYERADAHIKLSNDQITKELGRGKVSSSFLFSASRFNAWVSACSFDSAIQMKEAKLEIIEYFSTQYAKMLEENIDDYIENFESYMKQSEAREDV